VRYDPGYGAEKAIRTSDTRPAKNRLTMPGLPEIPQQHVINNVARSRFEVLLPPEFSRQYLATTPTMAATTLSSPVRAGQFNIISTSNSRVPRMFNLSTTASSSRSR
jgi:hypothetical protein